MADDRYGGYGRREGWRGRESSIFSDDDERWDRGAGRWSGDYGRERGGRDEDRGFFERAGDELRSWFGNEEAERRRERDMMRDDARSAFGGGRGDERGYEGTWGGGASGFRAGYDTSALEPGSDWWGRGGRERAGWGSGFGGSRDRGTPARYAGSRGEQGWRRPSYGGRSQWDDHYRHWRDQQIRQFDREYDEYIRERQQRFEQDFDTWRTSRLTEGGATSQTGGGSATGYAGDATRSQDTGRGTTRSLGAERVGATPGGVTGAAIGSSTGGAGAATETSSRTGTSETAGGGRGRGSRSRT